MQGYFRELSPALCEMILDDRELRELDALWNELNSSRSPHAGSTRHFIFFERAERAAHYGR